MRVNPAPLESAEVVALAQEIMNRRRGPLLQLDQALLHSPTFARAWHEFFRAIRMQLALDPQKLELTVCYVGVLNAAEYEVHHHAPGYLEAGGSPAKLQALRETPAKIEASGLFDPIELSILALARAMTRNLEVGEAEFQTVRSALGDQLTIELIGVIGAYNMVSRMILALDLQPECDDKTEAPTLPV